MNPPTVSLSSLEGLKDLVAKNDAEATARVLGILRETKETKGTQANAKIPTYDLVYPHGEHLLHWACAYDNEAVVEYLLTERGVHVHLETAKGASPLQYATLHKAKNAIRVLNRHNATIPKIPGNVPLVGYRYRLYRQWLTSLNTVYNQRNASQYRVAGSAGPESDSVPPEAGTLLREGGIEALARRCHVLYTDYLKVSQLCREGALPEKACVVCGKETGVDHCFNCKRAWFCSNACELRAHPLHRYDCHHRSAS